MEHSRSYVTEPQRRIAPVTFEKNIDDVRLAIEGVGRDALGPLLGKQKRTSEMNSKGTIARKQARYVQPGSWDAIVLPSLFHGC